MTAVVVEDVAVEVVRPPRWLLVASGVLWVVVALSILSFDSSSVTTIAYLMAFVLVFAGVGELMSMAVAPGWKWLHGLFGVLFIVGGVGALARPFHTFGILALFMGWYLVLKGSLDIAVAISFRQQIPVWGLSLAVGISEVLIGLWAVGYPGRSAWLLIFWVGTGALLRGIGDLVAGLVGGRA